jgi:hypothetical protein
LILTEVKRKAQQLMEVLWNARLSALTRHSQRPTPTLATPRAREVSFLWCKKR